MSDLVKRLDDLCRCDPDETCHLCDAANEIERLQTERNALQTLLNEFLAHATALENGSDHSDRRVRACRNASGGDQHQTQGQQSTHSQCGGCDLLAEDLVRYRRRSSVVRGAALMVRFAFSMGNI